MVNKRNGLIPPPPPMEMAMAPGQSGMMLGGQNMPVVAQALANPQGAMPTQPFMPPVQLPDFPTADTSAPILDPAEYQNLQDRAGEQKSMSDQALERYKQLQQEDPEVPSMHQSPFEQSMSHGLQEQITKLMAGSGKEGPLSRFGKGFEAGQQIAGNLIVPLMGAMSHTAGGAMGAAMASQQLRQSVSQQRAQRRAEEDAHNSMLAHLSSIYESMDPQSAKNLFALASAKMKANQAHKTELNQAFTDVLHASKDAQDAQKDVLSAKTKAAEATGDRSLKVFDSKTRAAGVLAEANHRGVLESNEKTRLNNQGEEIGLRRQQLADQKTRGDASASQANANLQEKAQEQVALRLKQLREDLTARNAQNPNMPKYPDAQAYIKRNPAEVEILNKLFKTAGMKATAEDMIAHITDQGKTGAAHASNPLADIMNFANQGANALWPAPGPQPAAKQPDLSSFAKGFKISTQAATAAKQKNYGAAVREAAGAFQKQFNRQPSPEELQRILKEAQ